MPSLLRRMIGVALASVLVASCGDDSNPPDGPGEDRAEFPDAAGTRWVYGVSGIGGLVDTVRVTVLEKHASASDESTATWQISYPDHVETLLVRSRADTVTFDRCGFPPWFIDRLVLPDSGGEVWPCSCISVSQCRVVADSAVTVPAGHFASTYYISSLDSGIGFQAIIHLWFRPGVGLVKSYRGTVPSSTTKWCELLDYDVGG